MSAEIRQFAPADDPEAAKAVLETLSQSMGTMESNSLWSADPNSGHARWHAIGLNMQLDLWNTRMLYTMADHAAIAYCYWYPDEKAADGPWPPPGGIDSSQWYRPEALPILGKLLDFLTEGKQEFAKEHGTFLYLSFLSVLPDRHGKGLGSQLLRHLTSKADAAGRWMYLEASNDNNARLYARHGFEITHRGRQEWSLPELCPGQSVTLIPMARRPTPAASVPPQ